MAMYDSDLITNHSFDLNYIPPYLQQAQWAEMIELKKTIHQLSKKLHKKISILDIGVGNARVPLQLSGIPEIWNCIEKYVGTDNAMNCVNIAKQVVIDNKLADKVDIVLLDAEDLASTPNSYDMIITTWFTGGNFYPSTYSFSEIENHWQPIDLTFNPKFDKVFSTAFNLLNKHGLLVFGALYLNNDATRIKQENAYKQMGMTVITNPKDDYTATKEGFWSQRFTPNLLQQYLHFAIPQNIFITPLDTYDYAVQVVAEKH